MSDDEIRRDMNLMNTKIDEQHLSILHLQRTIHEIEQQLHFDSSVAWLWTFIVCVLVLLNFFRLKN